MIEKAGQIRKKRILQPDSVRTTRVPDSVVVRGVTEAKPKMG
jgi:hypothetical protein